MSLTLGYTRVSTTGQHADLQRRALEDAGVTRVWEDTVSGVVDPAERPGFQRLLDAAREGDELVVWRLDRLGRSTASVLRTVELLDARGIRLRSIHDGIDTGGTTGKLVLTILAAVATMERELIHERTREGREAAKVRGVHMGRPPALGEEQRALVRRLRGEGQSLSACARAVGVSKTTIIRTLRDS